MAKALRMKLRPLVILVPLWLTAGGVQAQTASNSADVQNARKACRSDAMKLCPGKRGNEAAACLRSNSDKITADCKSALAKVPAPSGS
jgi:hypothetical protein